METAVGQLGALYAIWLREVKRALRDRGQLVGGLSRPILWVILLGIVYRPWSLEGSRIEVRDIMEPVPSLDVGVTWLRGKTLWPAAEAFRKFLALASREMPIHAPV